jgi:hypothetical protein
MPTQKQTKNHQTSPMQFKAVTIQLRGPKSRKRTVIRGAAQIQVDAKFFLVWN